MNRIAREAMAYSTNKGSPRSLLSSTKHIPWRGAECKPKPSAKEIAKFTRSTCEGALAT